MTNGSSKATYINYELVAWLLCVLTPGQSNSFVTLPKSLSTQPYGNCSNAFVSNGIAAGH